MDKSKHLPNHLIKAKAKAKAPAMLILASRSETRQKLLRDAGVTFHIRVSHVDETAEEAVQKLPKAIAQHLAAQKALVISQTHPSDLIIGCDQTLGCDGKILTKPTNKAEARIQLQQLRGKTHQLYSAIAIAENNRVQWQHCSVAHLTMRHFSEDFLTQYLREIPDHVLTSVGCYQYEGLGIQLFENIEGDYHTILGLPLLPLLDYLRTKGHLNS